MARATESANCLRSRHVFKVLPSQQVKDPFKIWVPKPGALNQSLIWSVPLAEHPEVSGEKWGQGFRCPFVFFLSLIAGQVPLCLTRRGLGRSWSGVPTGFFARLKASSFAQISRSPAWPLYADSVFRFPEGWLLGISLFLSPGLRKTKI